MATEKFLKEKNQIMLIK